MADVDEEQGYSDDDLDALPSDTFLELQQDAIRFTQQPNSATTIRAAVPNPSSTKTSTDHSTSANRASLRVKRNPLALPSSDYGELDEAVFEGETIDIADDDVINDGFENIGPQQAVGEHTQREQWRQQRYGQPLQQHMPRIQLDGARDGGPENGQFEEDDEMLDQPYSAEETDQPRTMHKDTTVEALQVQVQQLLRERETLQQAAQNANESARSKAGEISIIRANQAKAAKEHERQLESLKKSYAEQEALQKAEIEAARAERHRTETEIQFLRRDLTEEGERVRNLQKNTDRGRPKAGQQRAATNASLITTPRKGKGPAHRDGFDEMEVVAVSPSRLAMRSKPVTPKAGAKRKRKAVDDSPAPPLQLSPARVDELPKEPEEGQTHGSPGGGTIPRYQEVDHKFQFTQKILNHRIQHDRKRSFEELADYFLPSEPSTALSTKLLDKMSTLSFKSDIEDFPAALGIIIASLWSSCIKEKLYRPVHLLIDLVKIILFLSPFSTPPHLLDDLLPLTQSTADINLIPRFQRKPTSELNSEINTNDCLQILHLLASGCVDQEDDIARFWRSMRFDYILMTINIWQPIEDIQLMLSLLSSSVLQNTFAMVLSGGKDKQTEYEGHVIDRISAMLIETPKTIDATKIYDAVDIAEMRLQALSVLEELADSRHGGEVLAVNTFAIGRLVRTMNDELNALYDYKYGHEYRAELVNHATRLLYHLTSNYPNLIDMQEKLRVIPGGAHKHLIALTRLAFSEGIWYERGIEDDVVDCAHQMLEDSVTPEEGEALLEVFSSAR